MVCLGKNDLQTAAVRRSNDGALTWVNSTVSPTLVLPLALKFVPPRNLLVLVGYGPGLASVFQSTDGAAFSLWPEPSALNQIAYGVAYATATDTLVICGTNGISTPIIQTQVGAGSLWVRASVPATAVFVVRDVAYSDVLARWIVVCSSLSAGGSPIWWSNDGLIWTAAVDSTADGFGQFSVIFVNRLVVVAGDGMLVPKFSVRSSTDGGQTFFPSAKATYPTFGWSIAYHDTAKQYLLSGRLGGGYLASSLNLTTYSLVSSAFATVASSVTCAARSSRVSIFKTGLFLSPVQAQVLIVPPSQSPKFASTLNVTNELQNAGLMSLLAGSTGVVQKQFKAFDQSVTSFHSNATLTIFGTVEAAGSLHVILDSAPLGSTTFSVMMFQSMSGSFSSVAAIDESGRTNLCAALIQAPTGLSVTVSVCASPNVWEIIVIVIGTIIAGVAVALSVVCIARRMSTSWTEKKKIELRQRELEVQYKKF